MIPRHSSALKRFERAKRVPQTRKALFHRSITALSFFDAFGSVGEKFVRSIFENVNMKS